MYDRNYMQSSYAQAGVQSSIMGKVLGILGFSFVFTCIGAAVSPRLGPGGFMIGLVASIIAYIGLMIARERTPLNLFLLYTFTTAEGVLLGGVLERYVQAGLGRAVIDAAATTAVVTVAAGTYGVTTKRNLSGLASILGIGLFALIVALIIGLFVHLPGFQLAITIVGALLFTGFIVVDLNRIANTRQASEGAVVMMAVSVYLDIVNLFLFLLRLFSSNDD